MKKYFPVYLAIACCVMLFSASCKNGNQKDTYIKKLERNKESIAVGVYKPNDTDVVYVKEIIEALKIDGGIVAVTFNNEDIKRTKLDNIDVLLIPGFKKDSGLIPVNEEIKAIIKKFVESRGKGVVGICNGSNVLTASKKSNTLNLIDLKMVEPGVAENNHGIMPFELTEKGKEIFPELKSSQNLFIDFHNGPFIEMDYNTNQSLFLVGNKLDEKDSIPFFVSGKAGKGKIFVTTAHPETTPGMRWMIPRMVRWVIGRDLVSYGQNVVRPDFFTEQITITKDFSDMIDEQIDLLVNGDKNQKIKAMDKLQHFYPWLAAEKVIPLLSDQSDKVKLRAADFLTEIEYTAAIPDIENAIKKEKRRKTREQLLVFEADLKNMIEQQVSVN